jgi:uncharacterized protein (DUF885 family)
MSDEWEFSDRADDAEATFAALAERIVDGVLARDPVAATWLGEHRYDGRLPDLSEDGVAETLAMIDHALEAIDQVDDVALGTVSVVDLEILRTNLTREQLELDTIQAHTWDPLVANPGTAIHLLLARDFAPLDERLASVAARLDAVPESLAVARETLDEMPRVHLETAIGQFEGARAMLTSVLENELESAPAMRARVEPAREAALAALDAHLGWMRDRLESGLATRDPRLGPEKFAAKLWTTLDAGLNPDDVLHRAEADLARIEGEIARAAAEYLGEPVPPPDDAARLVRRALDAVASDGVVTNDTVLDLCRNAFDRTTAFVESNELVSVFDIPMEIIEMPEIHRGVAVAYCDSPGPLEASQLTTFFAVSPTPSDWPQERVESFFREYNAHMVHNLTVHEAMPGHVLQLGHSNRYQSPTRVRQAFSSGPFAEGWAVYAEALMAERGYDEGLGERHALAVRLQQLKMQLRMTINAILDVRVHTRGMTEDEAMRLMQVRGHQEEGEAVGKWRRAQLTSCQLSTYYVGYIAMNDIVLDLRAANPGWSDRQVHDAVLAHGTPPPRHLRTLLGI